MMNLLSNQRNVYVKTALPVILMILVFLFFVPVQAQDNNSGSAIDLGIEQLTLEVGETYTFQIKQEQ